MEKIVKDKVRNDSPKLTYVGVYEILLPVKGNAWWVMMYEQSKE